MIWQVFSLEKCTSFEVEADVLKEININEGFNKIHNSVKSVNLNWFEFIRKSNNYNQYVSCWKL